MKVPVSLINKYNVPVPRYTSYPPANFFDDSFTAKEYLKAVEASNAEHPQNISIYIHIPFCTSLCYYCGCNTHITRDADLKHKYVDAIIKEVKMIRPRLDRNRKVSQIHWGGGTPNALPVSFIGEIMNVLQSEFSFVPDAEVAIECNPAALNAEYIQALYGFGFNRISLGVQDFERKVLDAVNREIPTIKIAQLVDIIRQKGNMSVNLDFVYGLPLQTVNSFSETIKEAIKLDVERLVTFSYAHVPWVKQVQKKLEEYGLPTSNEKLMMFENSWNQLSEAGYTSIGIDHYAKANDALVKALESKKLHRNFQGYCTRETTGQVYAFGTTGISQLENVYAQNARTVKSYLEHINKGEILIEKGYILNDNEKIIRSIINELMCNQYLSWEKLSTDFNRTITDIKAILDFDNSKLDIFKDDNLLEYNDAEITIKSDGRFVIRNIASVFDVNLKGSNKKFSTSV